MAGQEPGNHLKRLVRSLHHVSPHCPVGVHIDETWSQQLLGVAHNLEFVPGKSHGPPTPDLQDLGTFHQNHAIQNHPVGSHHSAGRHRQSLHVPSPCPVSV